jgi:hypothetical protein
MPVVDAASLPLEIVEAIQQGEFKASQTTLCFEDELNGFDSGPLQAPTPCAFSPRSGTGGAELPPSSVRPITLASAPAVHVLAPSSATHVEVLSNASLWELRLPPDGAGVDPAIWLRPAEAAFDAHSAPVESTAAACAAWVRATAPVVAGPPIASVEADAFEEEDDTNTDAPAHSRHLRARYFAEIDLRPTGGADAAAGLSRVGLPPATPSGQVGLRHVVLKAFGRAPANAFVLHHLGLRFGGESSTSADLFSCPRFEPAPGTAACVGQAASEIVAVPPHPATSGMVGLLSSPPSLATAAAESNSNFALAMLTQAVHRLTAACAERHEETHLALAAMDARLGRIEASMGSVLAAVAARKGEADER